MACLVGPALPPDEAGPECAGESYRGGFRSGIGFSLPAEVRAGALPAGPVGVGEAAVAGGAPVPAVGSLHLVGVPVGEGRMTINAPRSGPANRAVIAHTASAAINASSTKPTSGPCAERTIGRVECRVRRGICDPTYLLMSLQ